MNSESTVYSRRYHPPELDLPTGLPAEVARRLADTVTAAIARAVRDGGPEPRLRLANADSRPAGRARPAGDPAHDVVVPSYDDGRGDPVVVPVIGGGDGPRDVTVTVRWSEDEGEFFRTVVAVLAATPAFRRLGRSGLYGPVYQPAVDLHRDLAPRLGSAFRGRIELRVTAQVERGWVRDVTVAQTRPAARQRPAPPDAETVAGAEGGLIAQLIRMLVHATERAEFDLINTYGRVEMAAYHVRGTSARTEVDWVSTRDSLKSTLELIGVATHTVLVYSLTVELVRGVWRMARFEVLAEVKPRPASAPADPDGGGYDESQQIIDEINGTHRLILGTAAMLIQEQDPTRLRNIVLMVAPFALIKLGRFVNTARVTRLANLRALRLPKVSALFRGRYAVVAKLDRTLVETARELRASQAGVRLEDFSRTNVAVARVRIDGELHYLDAGNVQAAVVGAQRGYDSEQMIVTQVMELRRQGRKVSIEQLYSERIPCVTCSRMLDDHFPEASIFYTVPESRQLGEVTRGEALMQAYGLTPP